MAVTITGTVEDPSTPGEPMQGTLVFEPRPGAFKAEGSLNIGITEVQLDATGQFTASLKYAPGLTWRVSRYPSAGGFPAFWFETPPDGSTVDILDLVPLAVPAGLSPGLYIGANDLTVGTVTTGAPGSPADAQITGLSPHQVLDLTIPQGIPGPPGDITAVAVTDVTVLPDRVLGVDAAGDLRVGDGVSVWTDLPTVITTATIGSYLDGGQL